MRDFRRALTLSLRYRWSMAGVMVSAMMVALFWGANLGTVYPIVEVVLKDRPLHEWIDDSILESRAKIAAYESELSEPLHGVVGSPTKAAETPRDFYVQSQLDAERKALAWAERCQPWIHRFMPAQPFATLIVVVVFLLIGTLLKTFFLFSGVVLVERISQLAILDLRKAFYRKTLSMSLAHFSDDGSSELLSRFTHDMEALTIGVRTVWGRAVREPLKIAVCFIGAAFICWRLLLFCLFIAPFAIYVINRLAQSVKRANRRAMAEMTQLYRQLSESIQGIQAVKAFTMERFERRRFHEIGKQYFRRAQRIAVYNVLTRGSTELMSMCVVAVAITAGGYLVLNHETHLWGIRLSSRPLSFGSLMAFFALLAGMSDPFRKLAEVYNQVQRAAAAADRIYELMDRETTISNPESPQPIPRPLRQLEFRQVDFRYDSAHPVLRDVELRIEAGQTLAIVGPNGCGKSTLAKLIPRFFDPQSGQVVWNGVDLREVKLSELRGQIGLVTQHTMLFDDTVMNNIRYGSLQATDEEVIEAARRAHAHRFITERLRDGYQTVIGESGSRLSGGQRQRIALARAILRDPELLILDEATSQIDIESEQLIHQALREFIRGRTAIMITHRLSTLDLADKILVMDSGHCVDQGTHQELMQRCAVYQNLHELQLRASA
ncbi:MAG: ABC transporter ATP-binding protein [Planctomycetales bacterium]|nr:ABC transporter ATP-binding protein [Planctomycetales bacterium]